MTIEDQKLPDMSKIAPYQRAVTCVKLLSNPWKTKSLFVAEKAIHLEQSGIPRQEISRLLTKTVKGVSKQTVRRVCSRLGYTRHYINDNEHPNPSSIEESLKIRPPK